MTVLLTGGAGYIGSHMAALLLEKDIEFIIVDNLVNSDTSNLESLKKYFKKDIIFHQIDIRDKEKISDIFQRYKILSIMHFAGLKSVPQSIKNPKLYTDVNVNGSKILFSVAKAFHVKNLIFSSSASVYGEPKYLPIDENHETNPMNPYGQSKIDVENLLVNDVYFNKECSTKILRYFNPIGSYKEGIIGENITGFSDNLMPKILDNAFKLNAFINLYGDDFDTYDGSAIRDYIHVMDLIDAHYLSYIYQTKGLSIMNVGTGKGTSLFEIVKTFEKVNNLKISYKISPRREGDPQKIFADSSKLQNKLDWAPKRTLRKMCLDAYQYMFRK